MVPKKLREITRRYVEDFATTSKPINLQHDNLRSLAFAKLSNCKIMTLIFELLKIIVGTQREFSVAPSQKEWKQLFLFLQQQSLLGVALPMLKTLPREQCPTGDLPLVWYTLGDRLRLMNADLNRKCVEVSQWFEEHGFHTCILKGQGNAAMYPDPSLRNSGDIDVWLWPRTVNGKRLMVNGEGGTGTLLSKTSLKKRRAEILKFVRTSLGEQDVFYHHVDFPMFEGTEVEVHFMPTWMNSYFNNNKLQRFLEAEAEASFHNETSIGEGQVIHTPTWVMNVVFQLIHIQKHLFAEGIGLRQVMDYYYLLLRRGSEDECQKVLDVVHDLGLDTFLASLQWVLQQVFGLKDEYLIGTTDKENGALLLGEILSGGNFGKFGANSDIGGSERLLVRMTKKLRRGWNFRHLVRDEVLWMPLFKTWQYFWRKMV